MPTLPKKFAFTNCDVEEAWSPLVNQIGVEVELAAAPKLVVGVNGKICARDDEEILLLKVVQSLLLRYPLVELVAWVMESVEPENARGPETVAVKSEPVPLPTRRPESVVEPVPPFAAVS